MLSFRLLPHSALPLVSATRAVPTVPVRSGVADRGPGSAAEKSSTGYLGSAGFPGSVGVAGPAGRVMRMRSDQAGPVHRFGGMALIHDANDGKAGNRRDRANQKPASRPGYPVGA